MIAEMPALPDGATVAEQEAYRINRDQQQQCLDDELAAARTKMIDAVGAGPARADIYDATKRHKALLRERKAHAAGTAARQAALADGKSVEDADAAYFNAHRRALGTPTRGGGIFPYFERQHTDFANSS